MDKVTFRVPEGLEFIKKLSPHRSIFRDARSDPAKKVVVRKIADPCLDLVDTKYLLREIHVLTRLQHENLMSLVEILPPEGPDVMDIYLVNEFMDSDLHRVILSKQVFTEDHHRYFTYQILRGVQHLHAAGVMHRDLNPSNILVNKNCDLKISGFGLARGFLELVEDDDQYTSYVVKRWYRAPEVVLLSQYTSSLDLWSVGCIMGELINRTPLFPGKDHLDLMRKIVQKLGSPSDVDLDWLTPSCSGRRFLQQRCESCARQPWPELFPSAAPAAHEVLEALLHFNPRTRSTAQDAMELPYFESLHEPEAPLAIALQRLSGGAIAGLTLSGEERFQLPSFSSKVGEFRLEVAAALGCRPADLELVTTTRPGPLCERDVLDDIEEVVVKQNFERPDVVDWMDFEGAQQSKRLFQNYLYRECSKFNPHIVDRDRHLLSERGLLELLV